MKETDRRLTAIMFTDIFGYSRLMNRSEQKAFEVLQFHDEITGKRIHENKGTLIKRMGDATFSEFPSCLMAFETAIQLQQEIKKYNEGRAIEDRLIIRVGIHIGDVMVRDGDLFGDGVNTAARLEKLAPPGGICLSDAAYSAIRGFSDVTLHRMDHVQLKNIAGELTIYLTDSIYPEEFSVPEMQEQADMPARFMIHSIKKVPPEKRGPFESFFVAVAILFLINVFMVLLHSSLSGDSFIESYRSFTEKDLIFILIIIYDVFFISIITITRTRSAMKVTFEDVRGVDKLLNLVVMKVGFRKPTMKEGDLIFKPTTYNFLIWNTQKMIVNISGNHVFISGSYLFIRKVRKMIEAYAS